jgi:hypothetical protein
MADPQVFLSFVAAMSVAFLALPVLALLGAVVWVAYRILTEG